MKSKGSNHGMKWKRHALDWVVWPRTQSYYGEDSTSEGSIVVNSEKATESISLVGGGAFEWTVFNSKIIHFPTRNSRHRGNMAAFADSKGPRGKGFICIKWNLHKYFSKNKWSQPHSLCLDRSSLADVNGRGSWYPELSSCESWALAPMTGPRVPAPELTHLPLKYTPRRRS